MPKSFEDEFRDKFCYSWDKDSIRSTVYPEKILSWLQSKLVEQKARHVEIANGEGSKFGKNAEPDYVAELIAKAIKQDGGE